MTNHLMAVYHAYSEKQRSNSPFIQSTVVTRYASPRFRLMVLSNIEIIQFYKPAHQQSQGGYGI